MPSGIADWSKTDGFAASWDLDDVLEGGGTHGPVDAVMMLRVQRERMSGGFFPTAREYTVGFGLTRDRLRALTDANPDVVICHPGPMNRGLEIAPTSPTPPRASSSTRSRPASRCGCPCSTTCSRREGAAA